MRLRTFSLSLAVASLGVASSAFAGYTAVSNTFAVNNSGTPVVGATFFTDNGSFSSFLGDTAQDPSVTGGDLDRFKFDLDGTLTAINGNVGTYNGTYSIFYDQDLGGTANEGIFVSTGNFTFDATFDASNNATLLGSLVQTGGPSGPGSSNFRDLGTTYNFNPVVLTGTYQGGSTLVAQAQITLRQNAAPVPEPATMAALGLGALALIRRRRASR